MSILVHGYGSFGCTDKKFGPNVWVLASSYRVWATDTDVDSQSPLINNVRRGGAYVMHRVHFEMYGGEEAGGVAGWDGARTLGAQGWDLGAAGG